MVFAKSFLRLVNPDLIVVPLQPHFMPLFSPKSLNPHTFMLQVDAGIQKLLTESVLTQLAYFIYEISNVVVRKPTGSF